MPFAPFAEFGVVPFDAAAGGASFAAGPPSGLAVAALAESMAALAFVCSKSVCGGWPSAQSVSRVRRPHSPTLRFVRLLVGGDQGRVCSRVSSSVRPSRKNKNRDDEKNVGIFGPKGPKAFHFYSLSLSLSLSICLDSHLSRQRAAGDSLSLPAEPRRPSRGKGRVQPHPVDLSLSTATHNHCPHPKKKVSLSKQPTAVLRARAKKRKRRERDDAKGARPPLGPLGPRRRLRCRCRRRGADEKQFFSSRLLSLVVGAENETPVSCSLWPLFGHGFAQCRKRVLIGNVTGSREWGSTASHLRPLVVTTWVRFVYKSLVGEPYARVSA